MAKRILAFYIGGMGDYYSELLSGFGFADECKRIAELYEEGDARAGGGGRVGSHDRGAHHLRRACALHRGAPPPSQLRHRSADPQLPSDTPWELVEMFIRGMAPHA
jgi:hypothetical protein